MTLSELLQNPTQHLGFKNYCLKHAAAHAHHILGNIFLIVKKKKSYIIQI